MVKCESVYCVRFGPEHQFDRELCKLVFPDDEFVFIDTPDIPFPPDSKYFCKKPKSKMPYGCAPHSTAESPQQMSSQQVDKNPQDYINAFFLRWMAIEKRGEILDNPMAPLVELSQAKDFGGYKHEITIAMFTLATLPKDTQIGFVANLISKGDAISIKHIGSLAKGAEWASNVISTRLQDKIQDLYQRMAEMRNTIAQIKNNSNQNEERLRTGLNIIEELVTKLLVQTAKKDYPLIQIDIPDERE